MAAYYFVKRGMDITSTRNTGPGCTLSRDYKQQAIELPDNMSEQGLLDYLVNLMSQAGLKVPKTFAVSADDMGRTIIYSRKMAVAGLVPAERWAGFLFCPKA